MPPETDKVRMLVIRSWTESLVELRLALWNASINARIVRVDLEPALNAALIRSGFDVVLFDPKTPKITRDLVDARLRDHRCHAPVLELAGIESTVELVKRVLSTRLN